MKTGIFALAAAVLFAAPTGAQTPPSPPAPVIARSVPQPGSGPVQILYVVPSDRVTNDRYAREILRGVRHFQHWLSVQLDGRSFQLTPTPVRVVKVQRTAAWFSGNHTHQGFGAFSRNTMDELQAMGVARYLDPSIRYLVVVDADLACGQSGTGGRGVAVVEGNTFRGLTGEPIVPACPRPNGAEIQKRCRWVGGIGHELLHTMGLGHSDQFADCGPGECQNKALMKFGYVAYPAANLRPQEKDFLKSSGFITQVGVADQGRCD